MPLVRPQLGLLPHAASFSAALEQRVLHLIDVEIAELESMDHSKRRRPMTPLTSELRDALRRDLRRKAPLHEIEFVASDIRAIHILLETFVSYEEELLDANDTSRHG